MSEKPTFALLAFWELQVSGSGLDHLLVMLFAEPSGDAPGHRRTILEGDDKVGPARDLLVQTTLGVVGSHLLPVGAGEGVERQNIGSGFCQHRGGIRKAITQLVYDALQLHVYLLGERLMDHN